MNLPSPDSTSATRDIEFLDPRPPQEIQFDLERDLMVRLRGAQSGGHLAFMGTFKVNGAKAQVFLEFMAALRQTNAYLLRISLTWADLPGEQHAYHRQAAEGWFDLWTRWITGAPAPGPNENIPDLYARLATQALDAEAPFSQTGAIHQQILSGLRAGSTFSTAHKEGGTVISWQNGRFIRADYGESRERVVFPDEAALFAFLRNLYHWETGRHCLPAEPSEVDRWTLILRQLRPAPGCPPGGRGSNRLGLPGGGSGKLYGGHTATQIILAFVIAAAAVGGLVFLRGGPSFFHSIHGQRQTTPVPPAKLPAFHFRPVR